MLEPVNGYDVLS